MYGTASFTLAQGFPVPLDVPRRFGGACPWSPSFRTTYVVASVRVTVERNRKRPNLGRFVGEGREVGIQV